MATKAQLLDTIAEQTGLITSLNQRNADNIEKLMNEQTRLSDVITNLERAVRDRDSKITRANADLEAVCADRDHLRTDIARLGGMIDGWREVGLLPLPTDINTSNEYVINNVFPPAREPWKWPIK